MRTRHGVWKFGGQVGRIQRGGRLFVSGCGGARLLLRRPTRAPLRLLSIGALWLPASASPVSKQNTILLNKYNIIRYKSII